MLRAHKNETIKELVEVAKISLLLTGIIFAALFVIVVIGAIFSSPPLKAILLIFLSLWLIFFLITYAVYQWKGRKQKIK